MNLITKSILSIGLLAFVATQLYLTIFGGFLWPFSSHRLFSQLSTPQKTIVQAVLVDSNNNTYTVHPGPSWFLDGKRILHETLLLGTPLGKWLTQWPWIFQLFGIGTGVFELILPFGFFFKRTQVYVAAAAILFHLSTFIVMGISFWFLWALFPGLFFYKWIRERELILVHQS